MAGVRHCCKVAGYRDATQSKEAQNKHELELLGLSHAESLRLLKVTLNQRSLEAKLERDLRSKKIAEVLNSENLSNYWQFSTK